MAITIKADKYYKKPMVKLDLRDDEKDALGTIDDWLAELQILIGVNDELTSLSTGECMTGDEIWRARGIINMLLSNDYVELNRRGEDD